MSEGEQFDPKQEQGVAADDHSGHERRRKRRSHHHRGWVYKEDNVKSRRTIVFTAFAVLLVVILWYALISRPT